MHVTPLVSEIQPWYEETGVAAHGLTSSKFRFTACALADVLNIPHASTAKIVRREASTFPYPVTGAGESDALASHTLRTTRASGPRAVRDMGTRGNALS